MATYIFLDTSIYLHYRMFNEIDWPKLVDKKSVVIVLPPVTVRELNKHKDAHSVLRIKKRAATVLRKLYNLLQKDEHVFVRKGVDLRLEDRDPWIDYRLNQPDGTVADDQLIASILSLRAEEPKSEMILATADQGLHLIGKARRQAIRLLILPEEYRLPEEPDPAQKQIAELQRQLAQERERRPKLSLVFDNGEQYVKFCIYPPTSPSTEQILEQIGVVKQKHPKKELPQDTQGKTMRDIRDAAKTLGSSDHISMFVVTRADIEKYNDELEQFYQEYEQYLRRLSDHEDAKRKSATLDIQVKNAGTAPAEDLDVFLHFPDGFYLFDAKEFPEPPKPPRPPDTPASHFARMLRSEMIPLPSPYVGDLLDFGRDLNVSAPNIRRTHSYDVEIHVGKVKHGIPESLDALCVMFETYETSSSFEISYRILSASNPLRDEGTLHVIIEKVPPEA